MSANRKYIKLGPYKFRVFKVESDLGIKSCSSYQEAIDYVNEQKANWSTDLHFREYRITVIDTTILVLDDRIVNPAPSD